MERRGLRRSQLRHKAKLSKHVRIHGIRQQSCIGSLHVRGSAMENDRSRHWCVEESETSRSIKLSQCALQRKVARHHWERDKAWLYFWRIDARHWHRMAHRHSRQRPILSQSRMVKVESLDGTIERPGHASLLVQLCGCLIDQKTLHLRTRVKHASSRLLTDTAECVARKAAAALTSMVPTEA